MCAIRLVSHKFLNFLLLCCLVIGEIDAGNNTQHYWRELSSRIVGGKTVDSTRYPYFAKITIVTKDKRFQCGGTLIHPDIIMTAAHCYQGILDSGFNILRVNVAFGTASISNGRPTYEYQRLANKMETHPNYDESTHSNDIVIMKLDQAVSQIPIPNLPKPGKTPGAGASVSAIGYGQTSENGSFSSDLRSVQIKIVEYSDCNDSNSYSGRIKPDMMLCAGQEGGGKDSCSGDSGGPLIKEDDAATDDVILGITSWGTGCARPDKYGVYTKVSSYVQFIERAICKLSSKPPSSCNDSRNRETLPSKAPLQRKLRNTSK
jgi:secreted trypsin-like serine protease